MTAAELSALENHGPWTTDDLDELPESTRHHELIDGVLIVPPSPTHLHQTIVHRLMTVLEEGCSDDYYVTQGVEVRISKTRSFIPDVLVTTAEAAKRPTNKFAPHEVVLAVEIVSPTSVAMDHVTKSALYAQAGILWYWLVDTEPRITVRAFKLEPAADLYQPAGTFDEAVKLDEPWRIDFAVSRIMPRYPAQESQ